MFVLFFLQGYARSRGNLLRADLDLIQLIINLFQQIEYLKTGMDRKESIRIDKAALRMVTPYEKEMKSYSSTCNAATCGIK